MIIAIWLAVTAAIIAWCLYDDHRKAWQSESTFIFLVAPMWPFVLPVGGCFWLADRAYDLWTDWRDSRSGGDSA